MNFTSIQRFVIVLFYFFSVVLPHNLIGKLIGTYLGKPLGRPTYNLIVLLAGLAVVALSAFILRKKWRLLPKKNRLQFMPYGILISLMVIVSFKILVIVNIEIIHFIQYAVLALLLFPLVRTYKATLWWGTLLGIMDELYQYVILSPTSDYFDFNDVLFDEIGLCIGLLIMFIHQRVEAKPIPFLAMNSILLMLTMVIAVSVLMMISLGYISVLPDDDALFEMIRKDKIGFWRTIPPQVTFHVMRPLEGTLAIIMLFVVFIHFKFKGDVENKDVVI